MKKSWARKWVKALRSGKFIQGRSHLKLDGKHCCLGVLCELTPYKERFTEMRSSTRVGYNIHLPEEIKKLVGMQSMNRVFKVEMSASVLAAMNDTGKTFEEIADVIEEHWKEV
jgi:hypothetical protein